MKSVLLATLCLAGVAAAAGIKYPRFRASVGDKEGEIAKLCKMLNNDQTKEALTACRTARGSGDQCAEGILSCQKLTDAGTECGFIKNFVVNNAMFCEVKEGLSTKFKNEKHTCCAAKKEDGTSKSNGVVQGVRKAAGECPKCTSGEMIQCLAKEGVTTDGSEIRNIKKWHKKYCAAAEAAAAAAAKKAEAEAEKVRAEAAEKAADELKKKRAEAEALRKKEAAEEKTKADKLEEEKKAAIAAAAKAAKAAEEAAAAKKAAEEAAAKKDAAAKKAAEEKQKAAEEAAKAAKKAADDKQKELDEAEKKAAADKKAAEKKRKELEVEEAKKKAIDDAANKYATLLKITPTVITKTGQYGAGTVNKVELTQQIVFIAGEFGTTRTFPYAMLPAGEWEKCIALKGWMSDTPFTPSGKEIAKELAGAMTDGPLAGQQCKLRGFILDASKAGEVLPKKGWYHSAAYTRANYVKVLMTEAGVKADRLCVEPYKFADVPKTDLICGANVCKQCDEDEAQGFPCKNKGYVKEA